MIGSNFGDKVEGIRTRDRLVEDEMAAYDALPLILRRVLDEADLKFGAVEVFAYWQAYRGHFTEWDMARILCDRAVHISAHAHRETYGDMAPVVQAAAQGAPMVAPRSAQEGVG